MLFTRFQLVGNEVANGVECQKYQLIETRGDKINKYYYWVKVEVCTEATPKSA